MGEGKKKKTIKMDGGRMGKPKREGNIRGMDRWVDGKMRRKIMVREIRRTYEWMDGWITTLQGENAIPSCAGRW